MAALRRVPSPPDAFVEYGGRFEIVDGNRVDKVLAWPVTVQGQPANL